MKKLEPCPFCGGTNLEDMCTADPPYEAYIMCWSCDGSGPRGGSDKEAFALWNSRTETPVSDSLEDS